MRPTDEKIKRDIVDQLYWDNRVNVANIETKVRAGQVAISGKVPTYSARLAVDQDIKMIDGVTHVENNLVVLPPSSTILPDDKEIEKQVDTALAWNADIYSMDIEVVMNDKVVTLTGTVDEYWKKWKAEKIASEVNGVADVVNNLTIVTTKNFWDKDIAQDVEQALKRNVHIDAQNITVKVDRGKTILTGVVPSWFAHSEAEKCAAYTAGVIDVENNIIVKHH
jgi:osmotically-inducible protein OsmY